jgi:hypothetical protein
MQNAKCKQFPVRENGVRDVSPFTPLAQTASGLHSEF